MFRSESVEGFLSPSRCGSRNGEKDWENASTTSSVASATEYTGQWQQYSEKYLANSSSVHERFSHIFVSWNLVEDMFLKNVTFTFFKINGDNTRLKS